MKQTQWTVAAIVLAGMVFVVTFAMNYLGGRGGGGGGGGGGKRISDSTAGRELFFYREHKVFPEKGPPLEVEEKSDGHHDFWFRNIDTEPIKVGLYRKSCQCAAVEAFVLSDDAPRHLAAGVLAFVGVAPAGVLAPLTLQPLAMQVLTRGAEGHDLLNVKDSCTVPAGALGWVRLSWKSGKQGLQANLWMDNIETGKTSSLELRLHFQEPLRVRDNLDMGTIREEELEAGVTRHIECWSSTRTAFSLQTKVADTRDGLIHVGKPQPLSPEEKLELEQKNNRPESIARDASQGRVLAGYRIPVQVRADSKSSFVVGRFRRWVELSCPEMKTEPRRVLVMGRVRGVVEIGAEDEGEINFRTFRRVRGARKTISLTSDVPGLSLTVDRKRTADFLAARLEGPRALSEGKQTWDLHAEVLPNKAGGLFTHRDTRSTEDTAIYLEAKVPGKPARWVRIAVAGIATE